jgi:hypothetical protein
MASVKEVVTRYTSWPTPPPRASGATGSLPDQVMDEQMDGTIIYMANFHDTAPFTVAAR